MAFVLVGVVACSARSGAPDAPAVETGDDGAPGHEEGARDADRVVAQVAQYRARLRVLWKDAYRNAPGRNYSFLPPHTTTVLELESAPVGSTTWTPIAGKRFEHVNHGTSSTARIPDAPGGTLVLDLRNESFAEGTKAEVEALYDAYVACNCEGITTFLSLDDLSQITTTLGAGAKAAFRDYVSTHLTCAGLAPDPKAQLVAALNGTDVPAVANALAAVAQVFSTTPAAGKCSFAAGKSWPDAISTALSTGVGTTLAQYHVCNNEARNQIALVADFVANAHQVNDCKATAAYVARCRGPVFSL